MQKFLEAEHGGNPKVLYRKEEDRNRCYVQPQRQRYDLLNAALDQPLHLCSESPEDALVAMLDNELEINKALSEPGSVLASSFNDGDVTIRFRRPKVEKKRKRKKRKPCVSARQK